MGRLFQATANMLRGFVSIFVKEWALANPEAAYAGVIQRETERLEECIQAGKSIVADRMQFKAKLDVTRQQLAKKRGALQVTLRANDRRTGALILQQVKLLEEQEQDLAARFAEADEDATRAKNEIADARSKVLAFKARAATKISKLKNAQARASMRKLLDGLSTDGADQMIEAIDRGVDEAIAEVEIREEIDEETNLDRKVRDAERAAAPMAAEMDWDALRAQMESQQGTHAAASPPSDGGGKQA